MGVHKTVLICGAALVAGSAFSALRPPAVPLVTVDPFFSFWSRHDRPNEGETTMWFNWGYPLEIFAELDGVRYRLVGSPTLGGKEQDHGSDAPALRCVGCEVRPLTTVYAYEDGRYRLELSFLTAKLTEDLDVFSRPVTYVTARTSGARSVRVSVGLGDRVGRNDSKAEMDRREVKLAGMDAFRLGRKEQTPLVRRDYMDKVPIDWGYTYVVNCHPEGDDLHFLLAYDDIRTGTFLGKVVQAWWKRDGKSFETMIGEAERDYARVRAAADRFDREFLADVERFGGAKYRDIIALAYRQSFGACKLMAGPDGRPYYFSKECSSNGCMGTVDVFNPQFPHLLFTSLTLAKATLEPMLVYATSPKWKYPYAPHDIGLFPFADGQEYGMTVWNDRTKEAPDSARMPVEESANMLILLCAVADAEGDASFAAKWWSTVEKWANYLRDFGFDPGEQLCTDDFAGHLAHNANLSIKSILACGAYARMCKMLGKDADAAKFRAFAETSVGQWLEAAKGGAEGGYRLAFDRPDTWSLKYNLVWDRILGLKLFPKEVAEAEMKVYRAKALPYGPPLDSRASYTKADWMFWAGTMTGDPDDLAFMVDAYWKFVNETPDRHPLSDWYFANNGRQCSFHGRPVVGAFFMPMLADRELVRKWRKADGGGARVPSFVDAAPKRLCAHRGLPGSLPENSLPGLAAAVGLGAAEVEFDLWWTKDGEIVSIHDSSLERVSDGKGAVYEKTYDELRMLDFGGKHGKGFAGLRIMRFEDVLAKLSCHVLMNIHLKSPRDDAPWDERHLGKIVRLIDACGARGHVYFMTENGVLQDQLAALAPDIPRCMGHDWRQPDRIVERALAHKCQMVQLFKPHFDRSTIDRAHAAGLRCNVFWSDDPAEAKRFLDMGADTILTNDYLPIAAATGLK